MVEGFVGGYMSFGEYRSTAVYPQEGHCDFDDLLYNVIGYILCYAIFRTGQLFRCLVMFFIPLSCMRMVLPSLRRRIEPMIQKERYHFANERTDIALSSSV